MREFGLPIPLNKGLRPYPNTERNSGYMVETLNVKITESGLEPYEPLYIPFDRDTLNYLPLAFPWPQLVKGKSKTFLLYKTQIFLVNEFDWSMFELESFYDAVTAHSTPATGNLIGGNRWQFVDFWDTWAFHNGVDTVFHPGLSTYFGTTDRVFFTNAVRVQAGCAFKGRSWMGGFDSDYFYSSAWKSFIQGMVTKSKTAQSILSNLSENFVMTSSIGGGDMFMLFYATNWARDSFESVFGTSIDYFLEYWNDKISENTVYTAPMPWQGKVRVMLELGNSVMVYGDGGITALTPTGEYVAQDNYDDLKKGIYGSAVGGNKYEQLMIDQEGVLWYLEPNKRPVELGYKEWMFPMMGNDIVISHNPRRKGEFYICDGYKSFVLTKHGLTEHKQIVTSIIDSQGKAYCMGTYHEDVSGTMRVVTDSLDMNERGSKTVEWIDLTVNTSDQALYDDTTQVQVGFDYRYQNNQKYSRTDLRLTNYNGQVNFPMEAPDLRLVIQSNEFRNTVLKNAVLRYQVSDRRFVRGKMVTEL